MSTKKQPVKTLPILVNALQGWEGKSLCLLSLSKLHGHETEQENLFKACRKLVSCSANDAKSCQSLTILTGHLGTGKSHLANSLRTCVQADGRFFIFGQVLVAQMTQVFASLDLVLH